MYTVTSIERIFVEICNIHVHVFIGRYSPIGIMCLLAANVVDMEDPAKSFEQLVFYFLTVIVGLFVHGFITLPLIYLLFVRRNPFTYLAGMVEAMITALATASRYLCFY